MKFLLDTNVVSQPFAPKPDIRCLAWLEEQTEHSVATTSLTLAELWQGISNLSASDKRRGPLTTFVTELPSAMRLLNFDQRAARKWGEITKRGRDPLPVRDSLIAAIAQHQKLLKHFFWNHKSADSLTRFRTFYPLQTSRNHFSVLPPWLPPAPAPSRFTHT